MKITPPQFIWNDNHQEDAPNLSRDPKLGVSTKDRSFWFQCFLVPLSQSIEITRLF
jgi:hypothetical protein